MKHQIKELSDQENATISKILLLLQEVKSEEKKASLWADISSLALSCAIKYKKIQNESI